ncbi:Segregation/condensation protein A [[Mycoplasma] cavipharyngis]|uniref:segregation/condensation protein A n=1 Tax=[Mycoplasma] cavipharyngis TaxID=92757 RepID=UPI0037038D54
MSIKLIWCQDLQFGIGKNNQLPWKIPAEMEHFRSTTLNQIVVMGRKTFQSIGQALKNRTNIVLTRDPNFIAENVEVFHDIQSVLKKYHKQDLYIIGGKEIYQNFFNFADELIISCLPDAYQCDTFIDFDLSSFSLSHTKNYDGFSVNYYHYAKKNNVLELTLNDFHGPLDLLWSLIREKKYDIFDLDLKKLIEQYITFIKNQLNYINLDIAADYLLTATELISLKTKIIFANDPDATLADIDDFLKEKDLLIARLLEYKKIRKGISWLRKKQRDRINVFIKKPDFINQSEEIINENLYLPKNLDVYRLKKSLEIALEKMQMRNFKKRQLKIQELSIDQITLELEKWLINNKLSQSTFHTYLNSLSENKRNLKYTIVVFLVILTQVKNQCITIDLIDNDIHFTLTEKWDLKYE